MTNSAGWLTWTAELLQNNAHEPWAVAVIALLYSGCALAGLPVWPITVGLGFVYGRAWGMVAGSLGTTIGAASAFFVGRTVGRRWVRDRWGSSRLFQALDQATQERGGQIVFLTRLSPLLPYNVLNYLFGMTSIAGWKFVAVSWLGMLPTTFMYVTIGSAVQNLGELATSGKPRGPLEVSLLVAGVVATIAVVCFIGRGTQRAMRGSLGDG